MSIEHVVKGLEIELSEIRCVKSQLSAARQAVIAWFQDNAIRIDLSNRIDIATAPFVFSIAEKKKIVKYVLKEEIIKE